MNAQVPISDTGSASAGMSVAAIVFRNMKMTSTTRAIESASVNSTSSTDSRIERDRSFRMLTLMAGGNCACRLGIFSRIASTTSIVLASDWRNTASMMARSLLYHAASWSLTTPSTTLAISPSRMGAPLRKATTIDR